MAAVCDTSLTSVTHRAMVAVFGKEAVATYCRMNAFKYLWRMHDKDSVEMNVMKAVWFLQFSIGEDPRLRTRC